MAEDTDFSAAAELALRVPDSEKDRVAEEVSRIGPVPITVERGGTGAGGVSMLPQGTQRLAELEDQTDLAEAHLEQAELQTNLLQEVLESPGAGTGRSGEGGAGGGGAAGGLAAVRRTGGIGLGLAALGLTGAGFYGSGLLQGPYDSAGEGVPSALGGLSGLGAPGGPAMAAINPLFGAAGMAEEMGRLVRTGWTVGEDIGSSEFELSVPEWLQGLTDGVDVRLDLVEETLDGDTPTDGSADGGSPGGSTPPMDDVGGPDSVVRDELVDDTLEGTRGGSSQTGGSPGGSTPPMTDIGGPGTAAERGAALIDDVLGSTPPRNRGGPGGSTPPRGTSDATSNTARDRRRNNTRSVEVSQELTIEDRRDLDRKLEEVKRETLREVERKFD